MGTTPILGTEELGLDIGGAVIVADVSLEIAQGEFVGVIGPNGAGKTSLFNLLSGLRRASSGRVRLDGEDITTRPAYARTRLGLGRTFQVSNVFPLLPVRENVRLAAQARLGGTLRLWRRANSVKEAVEKADWALERVGLASAGRVGRGIPLARRQAPPRARDGARGRAPGDPARRADGRRLGRERPRARRADPHGSRRGEEDRADGRAPHRGRHRSRRPDRRHAPRPPARLRHARRRSCRTRPCRRRTWGSSCDRAARGSRPARPPRGLAHPPGRQLRRSRGHRDRAARTERRRQDDDAAGAARSRAPRGTGRSRRRRHHAGADPQDRPPRRRLRPRGPRRLRGAHRDREPRAGGSQRIEPLRARLRALPRAPDRAPSSGPARCRAGSSRWSRSRGRC